MLKKVAAALLGTSLLFGGITMTNSKETDAKVNYDLKGKVKNIIFMVPDGFSASYATNYRWYKGQEAAWDSMLVGMMRTYSANSEVTDSAAAGTAMATGYKTNNGVISMTPDGKSLKTLLEGAQEVGKATGLVATSTITHATPAVFSSHVASRASEADIAIQMLDHNVDVMLGGGKNNFITKAQGGKQETRDLLAEAKRAGYTIAEDANSLKEAKGEKVLGLFAPEGMAPELDRDETGQPSLADMTKTALNKLKKDKDGFFLMVEGSQIDWAGHAHDAAWAMKDAEAFEQAVKEVIRFAEKDGQTVVVVAGDHDTGGMSVGGYGQYDAKLEVLRNVTATGDFMVKQFNLDKTNIKEIVKTYTQIDLSDQEVEKIKAAGSKASIVLNEIISEKALVGWTSTQHTGVDVPLYAFGPKSDLFRGLKENIELPIIMGRLIGVNLR
ncbi:alkaline phosphatase [Ectobacillus sp. JY-23]|uniref:alkaline phosphatase n=1 Tax=Ectobacillus sp. JY-23 TaxID=2933872 RepID=UPI001FF6B093|nr:alkaline phosphatase [Ectobacillus sp. JY-23]UOY93145.1 alkaline phosphatase [Ectobacillus sp. JY-23]